MAMLYADENFPRRAILALRELGHNILTAAELDQANAGIPDEVVLKTAIEQKRAVLTLNRRDFIGLHMRNPDHQGIVVCTEDTDFTALAARIHEALTTEPDLAGKLVRVNM